MEMREMDKLAKNRWTEDPDTRTQQRIGKEEEEACILHSG
jgi:hypothetical protein